MVLQNIIKYNGVTPWVSPAVLVNKPDKAMRLCIDCRKANQCTVKESYPHPHIQDVLNFLYKNKWFTSFELLKDYHQFAAE